MICCDHPVAGAAVAMPTSLPARSGECAGSSINNQASSSSTCNTSKKKLYWSQNCSSPFIFVVYFRSLLIPVLPPRSSLDSPAPSQLPSFPVCLFGSPVFLPGSCFHAPKNPRNSLSLRGSQSSNSSLARPPATSSRSPSSQLNPPDHHCIDSLWYTVLTH